jgi:Mn-dependent DtxR family transcriptional regulator
MKPFMNKRYTSKQGQYLAFIYYYGKIHRQVSEVDMQRYFRVSAPSVHQMVLTLRPMDSSREHRAKLDRFVC